MTAVLTLAWPIRLKCTSPVRRSSVCGPDFAEPLAHSHKGRNYFAACTHFKGTGKIPDTCITALEVRSMRAVGMAFADRLFEYLNKPFMDNEEEER
jgi:hypothetical protein